jgi:hypothetical protein
MPSARYVDTRYIGFADTIYFAGGEMFFEKAIDKAVLL